MSMASMTRRMSAELCPIARLVLLDDIDADLPHSFLYGFDISIPVADGAFEDDVAVLFQLADDVVYS